MNKVKFSLKDLPDAEVIQVCTNLKTSLSGNASFPTRTLTIFGDVLTAGDNEGSLHVHWDPLDNGKSYEVQASADPFTPTSFTTHDTVTKSSTALTSLTSGSRTWVRVRAINSAGKGAWSDPAVKVVPLRQRQIMGDAPCPGPKIFFAFPAVLTVNLAA